MASEPTVQTGNPSDARRERKARSAKTGAAAREAAGPDRRGLVFERRYTTPGVHPFDAVEWERRDAVIGNERGEKIFEQRGVEVPRAWSQTATNVVVSKYFRGQLDTAERETSVRQLVSRVADTVHGWGVEGGYFASDEDAETFHAELTHVLLHQMACFNSPVWFNVGIEPRPQCSACFINSVDDTMESILGLAKTEGMLFKYGSGTGSNLSKLRASNEYLAGGGTASGPVSFMKGFDAFAGVIKSGGKTRRAAKMVILDVDHPDIREFIRCKAVEEQKAWALIEAGYEGGFNVAGGAYDSIFYQNANHSVRVTDEFMRALEEGGDFHTTARVGGHTMDTFPAADLMREIADAAWICGDPGMQYDTTINDWHTCAATDRIYASNPCVTGDTLVATSEGWRRIDSLVGKTARIVGLDGQPHVVDRIFPTGTKAVHRLRTRSGYEVRITGDHKVWTVDRGDVPVAELEVGDRLQLQGPGFGRTALGERLATAIGVAVGDGCLVRSHAAGREQEIVILTMGAGEAPVLERIAGAVNEEKALRRAVGAVGNPSPVRVGGTGGSVSRLSFSSRPVVDLFKRFAVLDEGSAGKRFTSALFDLDRPSLAAVLRGLFTADGTVADYGDKSQYVSLDSTSLELLRQVQLLLLGFGVKAKLYTGRRGGKTTQTLPDGRGGEREYAVAEMHSLRISRSSRLVFEREIGFEPGTAKAASLRALNDRVAAYRDELVDPVAEIEALEPEPVFDLTERTTSHFVANGLTVHNCSEYMFLDDTACNLASLNLMKFYDSERGFDVGSFRHACEVVISAMEIIVDNASYPTPRIAENSRLFRPLGLGYANLGALLMARGLPYDSDAGRDYAGAITALMSGAAYAQSARIAGETGPFERFEENREPMLRVMRKHRDAVRGIDAAHVPLELLRAAKESWDEVVELGGENGIRNSQISVLAPTGTIAFMMDCDTTGVEPDIALVKYKKLVGGGMIKIVNQTVPLALARLGYDKDEIRAIVEYVDENDTIEGAPGLADEHLPVFDCAFKPAKGSRSIRWMGHLKMLAAAQPFISGAISKTINMPEDSTVDDIAGAYMEGWRLGLKAVAIYRDGCKRSQPLSTRRDEGKLAPVPAEERIAVRVKLPDERRAVTHKFSVNEHEGYITVGLYDNGQPGEIFLTMAKEGSTISGLMDAFATAISIALQYGVPLHTLVDKFSHTRFEPSGFTRTPEIPFAKSITDYIFRWLALKFLSREEKVAAGLVLRDEPPAAAEGEAAAAAEPIATGATEPAHGAHGTNGHTGEQAKVTFLYQEDSPSCHECGSIMVRNGSCYKCLNCGSTSGCS